MDESKLRTGESPSQAVPAYVLQPGTVLNGRYRLEQMLGKGGFGITYKARDLTLDVPVAVKEYFPDRLVTRNAAQSGTVLVADGEKQNLARECENFLAEARRLGQFVDEPGIVGVRDFFRENGTAYIVMEYLSGETLRSFLDRQGKISMPDALALLEPVMRSLDKVHREGLIHRDISPENIFLTRQGAKLLDFGTARPAVSEGEGRHTVLVKPGYAPAEQYDEASSQGPWCDVYSLSAVLYECITAAAPQDSLRRLFKDSVLPPSQLGISLPAEQEKALMKGLALYREGRYQTVSELAGALGLPAFGPAAEQQPEGGEPTAPAADDGPEFPAFSKARQAAGPEPVFVEPPSRPEARGPERPVRNTEEKKPSAPEASAAKRRRERRRAKREHSFPVRKLLLLLGGILAVLAVAFAVFASSTAVLIGGTLYEKDATNVIRFDDMEVKAGEIKKIGRLTHLHNTIVFKNCRFAEGSIEALGQLENVSYLTVRGNVPAVEVDLPAITSLHLETIKKLDSLDFLRHFPSLTEFSLGMDYNFEGKITDFSPIATLTGLERLTINYIMSDNGVTDLSFLSGLNDLTSFHCDADTDTPESARITDISPLAGCPRLTELSLNDQRVGDLSPLAGCADLVSLDLNNNRVSTLAPLTGCAHLEWLQLEGNLLTSLEGLENAKSLQGLELGNNQLSDISALAGTAKISRFSANENSISDLTPLSENGSMEKIHVSKNALPSLDGCEKMVKLKELDASYNQIADLNGIRNCSVLETAGLSYNRLEDLRPLGNNGANLKYLEAAHNQIKTLDGLESCTGLEGLSCAFNEISDLSPLRNATGMAALLLAGNQIGGDLSALHGLTEMNFLDLRDNRLTSISGMENMTHLAYIDLSRNQIGDITGFPDISLTDPPSGSLFKSFTGTVLSADGFKVFLEHNQISALSPLPEGIEYRVLSVYDNPVGSFGLLLNLGYYRFAEVYITYREGVDMAPLISLFDRENPPYHLTLVDAPLDRQGQWEKDIEADRIGVSVHFLTSEAADADLAEFKPDSVADTVTQAGEKVNELTEGQDE